MGGDLGGDDGGEDARATLDHGRGGLVAGGFDAEDEAADGHMFSLAATCGGADTACAGTCGAAVAAGAARGDLRRNKLAGAGVS